MPNDRGQLRSCPDPRPSKVILSATLRMAEQGPAYIFDAFVLTYGTLVVRA
jgi:hypothetical protein